MRKHFKTFLLFLGALFALTGCGLVSDQPGDTVPDQSPSLSVSASKEVGLQCLGSGDLSCAKNNYCSLQGEAGVGLRCCLSTFLQTYFSDDTQKLGKQLGYSPVDFADLKKMSREEILANKALPFAELFLYPADETPALQSLFTSWAASLSHQNVSSEELSASLGKLGQGLEASMTCLEGVMGQVKNDKVEKSVFDTEEDIEVSRRDLQLARFALGASAYLLEFASQYQWGFDVFPALPLSDAFLRDVNGQASAGDARWGDLKEKGADAIVQKFGILRQALSGLKAFSDQEPSHIDDYLNWRFTTADQLYYSGVLKAAYDSLDSGGYVALPEDDYQVRLIALSLPDLIPNGKTLEDSLEVLHRNAAGEVELNKPFFKAWGWSVVRQNPVTGP